MVQDATEEEGNLPAPSIGAGRGRRSGERECHHAGARQVFAATAPDVFEDKLLQERLLHGHRDQGAGVRLGGTKGSLVHSRSAVQLQRHLQEVVAAG